MERSLIVLIGCALCALLGFLLCLAKAAGLTTAAWWLVALPFAVPLAAFAVLVGAVLGWMARGCP